MNIIPSNHIADTHIIRVTVFRILKERIGVYKLGIEIRGFLDMKGTQPLLF